VQETPEASYDDEHASILETAASLSLVADRAQSLDDAEAENRSAMAVAASTAADFSMETRYRRALTDVLDVGGTLMLSYLMLCILTSLYGLWWSNPRLGVLVNIIHAGVDLCHVVATMYCLRYICRSCRKILTPVLGRFEEMGQQRTRWQVQARRIRYGDA
jgi:hypothetical protein